MKEGALAGQEIELTQPRVLFGRDPSADIRIVDDITSRKHACISRQGDRYFLEDLGSSNATYLNGKC
jgi:pSer/pThr/pTyr-binding forkhead associated (FHA) protein